MLLLLAATVLGAPACDKDGGDEGAAEATEPKPADPADPEGQPGIELPGADGEEPAGEPGVKLPRGAVDDPADESLATPCTFDRAPECRDDVLGDVAMAGEHVYLMQRGKGVRRYSAELGDGTCKMTLDAGFGDGGLMAFPDVEPLEQKLDGPVYARSGGPKYAFAPGPKGSLYIYDFIDGIHRIAGDAGFERCVGVGGINAFAFAGKQPVIARSKELLRLQPGKKQCKAGKPITSDVSANDIAASGKSLYIAGRDADGEHRLIQVKGTEIAFTAGNDDAFADDGLCHASHVAPCGDAYCVADYNCTKLTRFAAEDGSFVSTAKNRDLFGRTANKVHGLAAASDGGILATVTHREQGKPCVYYLGP